MPGSSTIYDVRVRYALDGDKASSGLKEIARHADKAHESLFSIKNVIEGLAIKEVFHLGKEALVDFNNEMDSLKIGLSTVMNMNLHMPIEKANKEADKLFQTFQDLAKKSPLTTKDFAEMATAISPAIAMAGGGPEKLAKITQGALTAGLAYGQRPDIVAMDVQEMMMGNVTKRNRLGNELLQTIGMNHEDFNKKDAGTRAQLVEKMFSQEGLQKAADRFGETFKGQTSTLKDNLQIALGEVGKPLMEAMTAEVKKWNTWIEKHPKLIAETVQELGEMIKNAFDFVRNAAGWLIEHKDLLFSLGKVFLVFKGAQIGTNVFKKFVDGVGNLTDGIKKGYETIGGLFSGEGGIAGSFKSLTGILSGAGGVIPAFAALIPAVGALFELLNSHSEADKRAKERQMDIHEAVGDLPGLLNRRQNLTDALKGKGMLSGAAADPAMRERFQTELEGIQSKIFDPTKMGEILRKLDEEGKKHAGRGIKDLNESQFAHMTKFAPNVFDYRDKAETEKVTDEWMSVAKIMENVSSDMRNQFLRNAFPEQYGQPDQSAPKPVEAPWGAGTKPEVNITIQKIEVASEDPDRFVFGIVKLGEQATKHPTSSQHTTPGGF